MHSLNWNYEGLKFRKRYFVNGFEVDEVTYVMAESQNKRIAAIRRGVAMKSAARKRERETR